MKRRFDYCNTLTYYGFAIIPKKMLLLIKSNDNTWRINFHDFCEFYHSDLPNFNVLHEELQLWEHYWLQYKGEIPEDLLTTYQIMPKSFDNISILVRLLLTLPVTSCECERNFSAMKLLKTYTRSTMDATRLTGLAIMSVHSDIIPDIDKVIDLFGIDNRRLKFI
jgi:hypothetical protein